MLKRQPYAGPTPTPLDTAEFAKLQRWQWWMVRFYSGAMVAMGLAGLAIQFYGDQAWVRRSVVLTILGLVVAATWVQFREVCPRCSSTIGRQTRLFLPPKCKHCGVRFQDGPQV